MSETTLDKLIKKVNIGVKSTLLFNISETAEPMTKEGLSSGCVSLNIALSGHPFFGFCMGRIVEIYGVEQSGKSTLCFHIMREGQKKNLPVLYCDVENVLDFDYAKRIVDTNNLAISQPDSAEQSLNLLLTALSEGFKVIVLDSVAALVPQVEIENPVGKSHMGKIARLMSQTLRKLKSEVKKKNALIIFVNQIRYTMSSFGSPEVTTGGVALKFYSSYRLELRSPRGGAQKEKTLDETIEETGIVTKVKIVKNKVYPPYRTCEFIVNYGRGIDKIGDIANVLYERVSSKDTLLFKVDKVNKNCTKRVFLLSVSKHLISANEVKRKLVQMVET